MVRETDRPDGAGDAVNSGSAWEDRRVLEGVRRRDEEALERFFDASFPYVYNLAYRGMVEVTGTLLSIQRDANGTCVCVLEGIARGRRRGRPRTRYAGLPQSHDARRYRGDHTGQTHAPQWSARLRQARGRSSDGRRLTNVPCARALLQTKVKLRRAPRNRFDRYLAGRLDGEEGRARYVERGRHPRAALVVWSTLGTV